MKLMMRKLLFSSALSLFFFFTHPAFAAIDTPKLVVQLVIDQLRGDLIRQHQHQLSVKAVSDYLAEKLRQQPGIFQAYAIPFMQHNDWLADKFSKMVFAQRSGDLYLVPLTYHALVEPNIAPGSHGTPWNYDSYVALVVVHPKFKACQLHHLVSTTDIAPTLSAVLGIKYPSATVGQPLSDVIEWFSSQPKIVR